MTAAALDLSGIPGDDRDVALDDLHAAENDLRRSLLAAIAGPPAGEEREPFRIENDRLADWALRRLAGCRAEIAQVEAFADAEKDAIDVWEAARTAAARRFAALLETELVRYLRIQREDAAPGKAPNKVDLPGGKVKWARHPKIEVVDPDAFIAWAEANGYASAVKRLTQPPPPSPLVSELKPHLRKDDVTGLIMAVTKDGEDVPGIRIDPNEKWDVEPARPVEAPR